MCGVGLNYLCISFGKNCVGGCGTGASIGLGLYGMGVYGARVRGLRVCDVGVGIGIEVNGVGLYCTGNRICTIDYGMGAYSIDNGGGTSIKGDDGCGFAVGNCSSAGHGGADA